MTDAELAALAGLTSAANKVPYFTGTGTAALLTRDTDGTLAANSDTNLATQKAVKTYVDNAVTGLLDLKSGTDCSGNPNYPAALNGDNYYVTVAGKIGGASVSSVGVGDAYFATADNAGGTQAAVGASWDILPHAGVAAGGGLLAANNLSDVASAGTSRTNLGATTAGANIFTLANPGAITFLRVNADNSVSALSASAFRTAIGAGVGGGDLVSTNNLSDVASKVAAKDTISVKGADIASATTTDLSAATGDYVNVTGTTTVTGLGTLAAGVERTVTFTGILTVTYNATSLILPGAANITTAAGDTAVFRSLGSGN